MINATPQTLKERFFQPPYVRGVAFSLLAFNFANLYRITCCCRQQWRAAGALRHATCRHTFVYNWYYNWRATRQDQMAGWKN